MANRELVKSYFIPIIEALKMCMGFGTQMDIVDCMMYTPAHEAGVDECALEQALKSLVALGIIVFADNRYTLNDVNYDTGTINPGHLLHEANVLLVEKKDFYEEAELSELKKILLEKLKKMEPYSFERLVARLLTALGFVSAKQMGGAGDGGRDVVAKYLINGIIEQEIIVQCKRYDKSVPSPDMQRFSGTLRNRNAIGIFVTTGEFTKESKAEAERASIQLIDGKKLVELLLKAGIGVDKETQTIYKIDVDAFVER